MKLKIFLCAQCFYGLIAKILHIIHFEEPLFSFRFSDVNNAKHNVFLAFNDFSFSCMTSTKSNNDRCDNTTKGSDICLAYLNREMFALFNVINFADVEDLK